MFKHLNVQFPPLGRTKRGVSPTQLIDIRQKCLSLGCLKASEFYGQNAFFGYDESRIYWYTIEISSFDIPAKLNS